MGESGRFEQLTLAGIAALHLGVGLTHTYSHAATDVPIPAAQQVYIAVVVTLLPPAVGDVSSQLAAPIDESRMNANGRY